MANLVTVAGADRVLTIDLHAAQIQGFFDIPTDNLYAAPLFARDIAARFDADKVVVVSPDVGGVARARGLAKRFGAELAIVDKRRDAPGVSEVMHVIGDVSDRHCILVDDIIDSGGTICNAADALLARGARDVSAYATHGVLSGAACDRIGGSSLATLTLTDTIPRQDAGGEHAKLRYLSTAPLLGEAVSRISEDRSVSSLFD